MGNEPALGFIRLSCLPDTLQIEKHIVNLCKKDVASVVGTMQRHKKALSQPLHEEECPLEDFVKLTALHTLNHDSWNEATSPK